MPIANTSIIAIIADHATYQPYSDALLNRLGWRETSKSDHCCTKQGTNDMPESHDTLPYCHCVCVSANGREKEKIKGTSKDILREG